MKTIELKWIEDDNHVVAEDAYNGLKELIDTGVFPDLTVKCEDDTLYITGEKSDLDKAVMKIQKAYAKYGQIMIKEAKNGVNQELRIESFDENVQDIFNHTLNDYNKFKSSKERPLNYVKQLNDYRFKFKKFYETAARSDKKLLKPYLDEISNLLDESEFMPKIKPIKKIDEGKLNDADDFNVLMELIDLGYNSDVASKLIKKYTNFINKELKDGAKPYWIAKLIEDDMVNHKYSNKNDEEELVKEAKEICEAAGKKVLNPEQNGFYDVLHELIGLGYNRIQAQDLIQKNVEYVYLELEKGHKPADIASVIDNEYVVENADNELTKHLGNLKNWGIIEENMTRKQYNAKYDKVALAYARETGMDLDDAYDELMDVDELVNWIEGPYDVDEIVYKLMNESTSMNESFLSPGELKKKLQRVAARWASIKGVKFEEAYNELRKKKSVKDMLDFYSVDEIIDDLSKNKKEVDDELEEEI